MSKVALAKKLCALVCCLVIVFVAVPVSGATDDYNSAISPNNIYNDNPNDD